MSAAPWAVQRAQLVRRAANIQNAVVGRRAQGILLRELENSAGEKVAGFHEAIPKFSRPVRLWLAPRHSGGEGIKLYSFIPSPPLWRGASQRRTGRLNFGMAS